MKTLAEFRKVGYKVDIQHLRNYKVAYLHPNTKQFSVVTRQYSTNTLQDMLSDNEGSNMLLNQLLARGGRTEVTVTDVETGVEYFAFAMCHEVDNYNKHTGVQLCLDRIFELMEQDVVESYAQHKFVN